MSDKSKIQWTDATWPVVSGCNRVSPGCDNCWAIRTARRLSANPNEKVANAYYGTVTKRNGRLDWSGPVHELHDRLDWPLKWKRSRRIFVASGGDLFHERISDHFIDSVFGVMAVCSQHTFQILTKRPKRMLAFLTERHPLEKIRRPWVGWPLPNVWLGISAEDQRTFDERVPLLLQTQVAVRFVSLEPLLSPIDIEYGVSGNPEQVSCRQHVTREMAMDAGDLALEGSLYSDDEWVQTTPTLDLVIVGGESGPNARPMHPQWARDIRDQCKAAGVSFFLKQRGEWLPQWEAADMGIKQGRDGNFTRIPMHGYSKVDPSLQITEMMLRVGNKKAGRELDGRTWDEMPEVTSG